MQWDEAHHRGAGFCQYLLRPTGVYSILTSLRQDMHLRPRDLMNRLAEANLADEPLVGMRDLSGGISALLARLCGLELIVRCVGGGPGVHTRYDLTRLGAGLALSLGPLTEWAMSDFDFVVAATRKRLGLPPLDGAVPEEMRQERRAAGMAIGLLSSQWSNPLMVYVGLAGPGGIGPNALRDTINADLAATSGEGRVVRRLQQSVMYPTLDRLVAKGLVERREDPPRVRYLLTSHGRGLMGAWWQVAEDFGIPHDAELFPVVAATSNWFARGY